VDFCFVRPGGDVATAIEQRAARWKGNSYVDYTFHVALQGPLPLKVFDQLPEAIQAGFPSFKVFTTEVLPPHPKRNPYRLDFGRIQLAMEKVAPHGGIMVVHAEDHDIVQFMYEKLREEGRMDGSNLPLVHNKLSEALSFRRTIHLAEATGAAIYFVHTSAQEGVDAVREARAKGQPVYAETLHHYACFTAEDYKRPRGFCYHTYPSLKYPEDQAALWDGLLRDGVSTTATDEFPTSLALKLRGKTIEDVTGGNLGAEARMGIVYTEGVGKRKMSLERFVQVTSSNAARILGLYPRKGAIAPGSDADLVLIDPGLRKALTREDFHVSDYSPWEGWEILGWPVTTVLRGKVLVEGGRLVRDARDGQLVSRKISNEVLGRPVC
jgi:dihydropyrimidinase